MLQTILRKWLLSSAGNPLIILDDADVDEAAETAVHHIAMNTGQVCSAATRVLIPESMKDAFEKRC